MIDSLPGPKPVAHTFVLTVDKESVKSLREKTAPKEVIETFDTGFSCIALYCTNRISEQRKNAMGEIEGLYYSGKAPLY